jgi:hypothetical protein
MRDLEDLGTEWLEIGRWLLDGDVTPFAYSMLAASFSKIASGFTRHLDPVNTAYGLLEGKRNEP